MKQKIIADENGRLILTKVPDDYCDEIDSKEIQSKKRKIKPPKKSYKKH